MAERTTQEAQCFKRCFYIVHIINTEEMFNIDMVATALNGNQGRK